MILVRHWQRGCAICGAEGALCEDHDHATGLIRGWLCDRCNLREGRRDAPPAFQKYRDRNPASMLGVVSRYRSPRTDHVDEWRQALIDLRRITDPDAVEKRRADIAQGLPDWLTTIPTWTPLMLAAHHVGLTLEEWDASQAERSSVASAEQVHLPNPLNPRLQACRSPDRAFEPGPPPRGVRRRPCPDCYRIDEGALRALLATTDEWGHTEHPLDTAGSRIDTGSLVYCPANQGGGAVNEIVRHPSGTHRIIVGWEHPRAGAGEADPDQLVVLPARCWPELLRRPTEDDIGQRAAP